MILGLFAILALVPLLGIAWILLYGSLFTVDGLFMSLILLTISGMFGTTALFELRRARSGKGHAAGRTSPQSRTTDASSASGGNIARGLVRDVQFYEADVGQPNKSIVILADGSQSTRTLVFGGDLRNALPVGQKVEVTFRKESGLNSLLNVNYS